MGRVVISSKVYSCMYKPISSIHWTPEYSWTFDRPQKQAPKSRSVNFYLWCYVSLLMKLLIDNENHTLLLCVCMQWVLAKPVIYYHVGEIECSKKPT